MAALSLAGVGAALPVSVADVRKGLATITDEAELKIANPDEIEDGCCAEADASEVLSKGVLVWSPAFEPSVTFSMNGCIATGGPPALSDGAFTRSGTIAAGRKCAADKGACKNCPGTATGKIGVGEILEVDAAAVGHAEFLVSLPFLLEGRPSRDFSETLFGRCKISCTTLANVAAGAEEVGFAAAVPEGAAVPDVTEKMFELELETGCMLSS